MNSVSVRKAGLLFLAVFGLVVVTGLLSGVVGPCHDDLTFQAPVPTVDSSLHASNDSIVVRYVDGDPLTDSGTISLSMTVRDDGTDAETTYDLADASGDFPVVPGRTFVQRNVTVGGNPLTADDVVVVTWQGYERPLPRYCLTSRGNATARTTLYRSDA